MLLKAISNNYFFLSHLTKQAVQLYLPDLPATDEGHMKCLQQNI